MLFTSQSLSFPICKMEIIRMRGDNMYVWGGGSWSCASHLTYTKLLISFPLDVFSQFLVIFFFGGGSVKNPPVMQKTWVQPLGLEDPLEKGMATHFSILA